jgi:hypothetical protein
MYKQMDFLPSSEPAWMKSITSANVCKYFYLMFGLVALLAGFVVLSDVFVIISSKGRTGWGLLVRSVLAFAIPVINALFLYILCSRSILSK